MQNKRQHIRKNWRWIIYLSALFLFALILQDVIREIIIFQRDIGRFQESLIEEIKLEVYDEVQFRNDEFQAVIDDLDEHADLHAVENIQPLLFAVEQVLLVTENSTVEEKQTYVVNAVENFEDDFEGHNYFIIDSAGNQIHDSNVESENLENIFDAQDSLGRYYIQDIINQSMLDENKEVLIHYYKESIETNEVETYVLYAMYFEDADYIIGTEFAMSNFYQKSLDGLMQKLGEYYNNSSRYVYVLSMDGEILFHINSSNIGKTIDTVNDPNWVSAMNAIYDFLETHTEGYLEYQFYDNAISGEVNKRYAYVLEVPEWDILLGSSITETEYDHLIDAYIADNYQNIILVKLPIYIILLSLTWVIYVFIKRNILLSITLFDEDEFLYRKFSDITNEIIMITDIKGNIVFMNRLGNKVIYGENEEPYPLNIDKIIGEEEGYSILYGKQENYYVKFNLDEVTYQGEKANLYILTDETDKITTEKELEALSQKDELTKLGNRRMLVKDYTHDYLPYITAGNIAYLVMIDLDNFKKANDIYGHKYGDDVLRIIANIFSHNLGKENVMYRVGGDEFTVITKGVTGAEIYQKLQEIQSIIANFEFTKPIDVGFSAGIVAMKSTDRKRRLSDYSEQADALLYQAKQQGKGTIVIEEA